LPNGKNDIDKSIKALSGGEKGRMLFGKLMLQNPNVLVMDEPTNHLELRNFVAITVETKNPLKVAVNQQNMAIKKTY
jgi:ATPase subunit of ABC transporter with duplicated ATPase domains